MSRMRFLSSGVLLASGVVFATAICTRAPRQALASEPPVLNSGSLTNGAVEGVVNYKADPKRPWRFARYYVRDGLLAEAVVALEPAPGTSIPAAAPAKTWPIDQLNFQFVPDTIAIRAGDSVRISNSEEALHNVMTSDGEKPFNLNLARGQQFTHMFERAGGLANPVRLGCVFHGGMRAWIYVFEHPWFQVTGPDGRFHFENVPPGRYTLGLVHPAGKLHWRGTLKINSKENPPVEISLSPGNEAVPGSAVEN